MTAQKAGPSVDATARHGTPVDPMPVMRPAPPEPGGATDPLSRAVVGVLLLLLVASAPSIARLARPGAAAQGREPVALQLRLNPNHAAAHELELLPGIGPALAARIVEFRERQTVLPDGEATQDEPGAHARGGPGAIVRDRGRPAFGCAEDLDHVRGIGPVRVAQLRPYWSFEDEK
jgi:predicted flap endonuclease-1-like 5' DNA nuclease